MVLLDADRERRQEAEERAKRARDAEFLTSTLSRLNDLAPTVVERLRAEAARGPVPLQSTSPLYLMRLASAIRRLDV